MTGVSTVQAAILKPVLKDLDEEKKSKIEEAVQAANEANGNYLLAETMAGVTQREKRAWFVAGLSLGCALLGLGVGAMGLAKSETHAYLALVDKDTGIAERAVSVERAGIEQRQAVVESLVHAYVKDRETYDFNDNEYRILSVFKRSAPSVRRPLEELWTPGNTLFPPDVYGLDGYVSITVNNIVPIDNDTMQVRFTKHLSRPNSPDQVGDFVATVSYVFEPSTVENNLLLWQNPLGFQVVGYRVASEGK